jgi:hypothetical protein
VDLAPATGELSVEWIDPIQGKVVPGRPALGGAEWTFRPPFPNDAILHLRTR